MTSCAVCGREDDETTVALTWSTSVERHRTVAVCDGCTRAHLRSMEAKLAPEHW